MSKKRIIAVIILVLAILIGIYFTGSFYYKDKFPSNVYVNEINIGGMTLQGADKELITKDIWDKIIIKSDTEEFLEIKAEEIDYKYVGNLDLPEIFNEQNKWKWFLNIFKHSSYTTTSSDYNKDKLKSMIDDIEKLDDKLLNAKVAYSDSSDIFVIEPHHYEIKITREQFFDLVAEHIKKRNSELNVEEHLKRPTLLDNDESLIKARDKANQYLNIQLKYDFGDREELIDRSLLKNWIIVNEKEVDINPEKVKEYVAELATKYDTYGRGREFETNTGQIIIASGGTYGWLIDKDQTVDALIEHIKTGGNKTIEPVYSSEALTRNANDIGNSYVEIDLDQQMVYVYIEGEQRVSTPTVTGNTTAGYNTPTGVDALIYKGTDVVLRGEDYAAPVEYWMPFNGDIGLHDADWRSAFGGDIYQGNGSHGCVNLPPENAKAIFDLVYPGMPVVVH